MGDMGIIFLGLVLFVFAIYVWFRIFEKAGYSGWLALLMMVPIANLILLLYFAFAEWPVQKK